MLIETVDLLTGQYHLKYISDSSPLLFEHDKHGHQNVGSGKAAKGAPDISKAKSKGSLQTIGADSLSEQQLNQLVAYLVSALTELERILHQSIASIKAEMKEIENMFRFLSPSKQLVIEKLLKSLKDDLKRDKKDLTLVHSMMTTLEQELKKPSLKPDAKMLHNFVGAVKGLEIEVHENLQMTGV